MLSQNTRKTKFGLEILISMLYTKCDRSKVHDLYGTLVGVARPLSMSHFILCNQAVGALGNDFLGLCIT